MIVAAIPPNLDPEIGQCLQRFSWILPTPDLDPGPLRSCLLIGKLFQYVRGESAKVDLANDERHVELLNSLVMLDLEAQASQL